MTSCPSTLVAAKQKICRLMAALILMITCLSPAPGRADVAVTVSIWHGYDFYYPNFSIDSTNAPLTYHWLENSSGLLWRQLGDTNGWSGFFLTNDLAAVLHECTNGLWKIHLNRGHPSEQIYYFKVSVDGVTAALLGDVNITFPTSGSTGVSTTPTYEWTGPNHLPQIQASSTHDTSGNNYFTALPGSATSWAPGTLTPGPNTLFVQYYSNDFSGITFTSPTNATGSPLPDWSARGEVHSYRFSVFTVAASAGTNSALAAHYTFDDPNELGKDSSHHGYDLNVGGAWNGGDVLDSSDAVAGSGAVEFYTDGDVGGGYLSYNPTPPGLLSALAGNFSVSVWVKTLQSFANSGDYAFDGASILAADVPGLGYDLVPMALTEGEVAFNTGGQFGDQSLNTTVDINDGNYHHVVVTRDQTSGEKNIYVDGALEVSGFDDADVLNEPVLLTVGALMDASEANPAIAGPRNGYEGLLDDLQIYSATLTPAQVGFLHTHPGAVVPESGIGGHTNLAHHRFQSEPLLGLDSSGKDNHFNSGSSWGTPVHAFDTNSVEGLGSVHFHGVSSMVHAPPNPAFTNLMSAVANSFSVSLWLNTENVVGGDADDAYAGAAVIWAYDSGADDIIPVAITGSKIAFHTGDEFGNSQTLHSTNSVTDGTYHHVVVTRNRATGEKKIYVDGVLEASAIGTTRVLDANDYYFSLGGVFAHSFSGYVDDLQIYSGVLSADEVTTLYNHPGTVIPDTTGISNPPANVEMEISITRNREFDSSEDFLCFPKLLSVNIPQTTEHVVESPTGAFDGHLNSSSSTIFASLGQVLNECTNGLWKLYLNKNHPSQRLFTFSVSITGLDTNLLKPVIITSPANGSSNVPANPVFNWTGPIGFSGIFLRKYEPPNNNSTFTNLAGEATFWPTPPTLNPGTNRFYLNYHSNNVPHIVCSLPIENGAGPPLNSWNAIGHLNSDATSQFVVTSGGGSPVQITNVISTGGLVQFQFLSQAGRPHTVETRTNLTTAPWVTVTNFTGDGSVVQMAFPIGAAQESYFRVGTQ